MNTGATGWGGVAPGMDFAQSAQQLAQGWTEALKGMTGVQLPADALPALQSTYLSEAAALWNQATQGADGAPPPADRRFAAKDWMSNPAAAFTAGMYMLNARTLLQLADQVQADEKTRQRIRFAVQQWIDASSPANYLALNPEAQRKAIETQGESITQGLQHLWHDVRQGHLSQTDESLFEVGRNVATTEGSVVFENALFQLIEYKPLTAKVHERPLLIVPPCINKFYIMDLQPENSLVRYAVSQGHRVFMLSWVNADESLGDKTWDDYIEHAVIRAIREVQAISKQGQINTLGFCIGGTLLATALAVLAARGEQPSASLTMLTSFLDFSDTGVLDLFVDEQMVAMREMALGQGGLLKGKELAATFSFLRPNDLVWNYVVGNYLKGETPPPFDLLYWNSDSTNLPGPMYCWYLRHTYLENNLIKPGKVTVCGQPLDLRKVNLPTFIYASREDHIVPWQSAYATVEVLPGKKQFVLGASGHIAGVINPPTKNKRSHWINSRLPKTADAWFEGATEHPGSWWPAWTDWLKPLGGKLVPAPKAPGDRNHKIIEPAPGRFVKAKA
ncbi:class I poly(R)-hydroxyalkanoic acid synthase [Methylibium sp. Pch-M]|uniref:PHA/PHB synthase family protein n=1 Tax=Methylibium sp. Pch-M TaxID=2082386 RepID=UPI0010102CC7|nr:class I poly(R)-hydroxyalkanoic acid synthase [Methylibium sp. Pch-M]QAZ41209.1 class I poly(R)-hydroxyalkanoic acid synthase [Methylibium sp. Pch-M]